MYPIRMSILVMAAATMFQVPALAGTGDTNWMAKGRYGIFLHYQYRILLGYSIKTNPQFPSPSQMMAQEWNRFVDGFDVKGFAEQMAEAKVGWVVFCIDDHYFAWPCAPNKAFSEFAGDAPGEKCSPSRLPAREGILWHGKIYCGNVYHGMGDANQFTDQELIDWIKTCNSQGGVCTLDWPFDPQTGLLKNFGITQLKRLA